MASELLVLTYEFPPAGGAGVQRIAKFARYLPLSGWTATVITSEPVWGRPKDETLAEDVRDVDVVRIPGLHVSAAIAKGLRPLKRLAGGRGAGSAAAAVPVAVSETPRGLSKKLSAWIAVPDDAAYWIGPAVRTAVEVGRRKRVRAVLASGPPHSVLVAGRSVARQLGVPLIVDLRDAWRDYPGATHPTALHRSRNLDLEREVMSASSWAVAASEPIAQEAREMGATHAEVLLNGFDPADLPEWRPEPASPLRVAYMGRFYTTYDPTPLLSAIDEARREGGPAEGMTLETVGPTSDALARVAGRLGLGDAVVQRGYRSHREALEITSHADVGLVVVEDRPGGDAVLTGKLFEYLGMGLPVLAVAPTSGAAATLVRRTGAGRAVAVADRAGIVSALGEFAAAKKAGTLTGADPGDVAPYDRREQARRLAEVLDEVTGGAE